jgi:hypothetical protein
MAALLTTQTSNTTSSGVATNATPAWIEVPNDSVFDGATLHIQASSANTAAKYSPLKSLRGTITQPGWVQLDLPSGTFVRVIQAKSGPRTNITVNLTPTA